MLERMVWPSNLRKGSSTGAEPVAMTMFLAVRVWSPTARVLAEVNQLNNQVLVRYFEAEWRKVIR